ncbi:ketopantoate reductase [Streptomyces sp. LBUM 1478]|uniref:Putative secreted protein n=1 Tax=Streptomyces scabiei (strain 87.22) TaxID=680198 RepID=C9ZAX8_STRSW|nr:MULTISPECIES: 2-dehydropantoate 2-reductase N-terminal domain-containing protein [Streptomyces]MBP5905748.1 ketopantoate reductase [Streptomyces sp. LBUM 1478]MBP5931657.1 ketopantoate reductase [Streptomyces sp. LBUM 1479]MBP5893826.1 ketopantoate reductase [Streptomyces sp. LBUM 1481]MBP5924078.1 ketopantoate reductase [Streptomyces sp. LBUM 1483]MDX2575728.1 2-dehydropantoate 2-reductase N-terminal domain-containing protein [Streptomyces scabiei]
MSKPSVLIVGAGAVGMAVGYHLSLAGADITFLVRPGRKAVFAAPQQLYSYDDAALKTFAGYTVVEGVDELVEPRFQFVVVTLDGHVSRSAEGTALLRALGDVIRGTDATVIMCGIGKGLREHYLDVMRIADDQLLAGMLAMLSHQADADLPVHAPTDPAMVAKASVCYRHPANKVGFRVGASNKAAAKKFAALYDLNGVSRCTAGNAFLVNSASAFFPMFSACEIAGWPDDFATVVADKELWRLACRAQGEIMSLPQNGLLGKVMAAVLGPRLTASVNLKVAREVGPLDYMAFSRFQHGDKVRVQDVESMRTDLADGRRQGRRMSALQELLARLEAHEAASHANMPS